MKSIRAVLPFVLVVAAAACVRVEREPALVHGAWARAADSAATTAAYLTFVNHDTMTVRVTSWSSPDAEAVELHQTMNMNGMMSMMPLTSPADVEPGDSLVLVPGARHLMVIGLKKKAVAGDSITLVLATDAGRSLRFGAKIRAP
ncbi:MAG: copper chaperone PCu(A)C [Gemmatimonadetes bacterium]|nr:copper chaperone PCu(A)C [Gemmatimonadota bacterium]MBI3504691.1 copper chaperone PCu(A)C [Pseudomonadota bacterium]